MAKLSLQDSGKYSNGGNTQYFKLENDGDIARVRLLYEDPNGEDLDYYLIHTVEIGGKKRYVNCTAVQDDGTLDTHKCPLCQGGYPRQEKIFLQMYNESEGEVQIWDRGKNFIPKIVSLINRLGSPVSQYIEIERNGKKNSQSTTYSFFLSNDVDGLGLQDFPEKQDLLEKFIIDASAEDMESMIAGTYKIAGSTPTRNEEVVRRDDRRSGSSTRPNNPRRNRDEII